MHNINENQIRQLYRVLGHEGHFSQVHCQDVNTKQLISRELLNGEEAVVEWAKEHNGKGNVFIGRNPRTISAVCETATTLSLDLDPIRPKGEAATEAQWKQALKAGRAIIQKLRHGVLSSSGNGALILFPLRESVDKDTAERYGKALEEISREILSDDEKTVQIDSTYDAPRLIKLLGTTSTKGDKNLWRQARWIDSPVKDFRHYDAFIQLLSQRSEEKPEGFKLPEIEKGELDRSKADISLANRLKLQGFSAEDTYRALCAHSFRPGRDDDYKRIIEKTYFNKGAVADLVSRGEGIQLWTPENGLTEYRSRNHKGTPELPTGFGSLDRATFGLQRGSIFTVAARTHCGKTTFAVSVASNLCRAGKRVAFISTETIFTEIWDRFAAVSTGISAFAIQHGTYPESAKESLDAFFTEFKTWPISIYDGSRPNIEVIKQVIETANPDVVVFDYFQHVESRETRDLENLVMAIKDLAKEKQVAILLCAMLHDGPINPKTNKLYPPTLGNMKNCKVINDESRVVLLLDWDRDTPGTDSAAVKVVMAKNKGTKEDVVLRLNRAIPRFE